MGRFDSSDQILVPLKRQRLSQSIISQLKSAIYNGQYKPGDRLPSENQLQEMLSVGRPVIREALRSLENSGLIRVRSGSGGGAFVRKIEPKVLSETFKGIICMDQVSFESVTDARMTFEMAMLPHVFERIDESDIEALEKSVAEARRCLESGIRDSKNMEFHILLARACKNVLLTKITEAIFMVLAEMIKDFPYSYERKRMVLEEHEYLLGILKKKDYKSFEREMPGHINGLIGIIHNSLK